MKDERRVRDGFHIECKRKGPLRSQNGAYQRFKQYTSDCGVRCHRHRIDFKARTHFKRRTQWTGSYFFEEVAVLVGDSRKAFKADVKRVVEILSNPHLA
jgi:hypothetical protein